MMYSVGDHASESVAAPANNLTAHSPVCASEMSIKFSSDPVAMKSPPLLNLTALTGLSNLVTV